MKKLLFLIVPILLLSTIGLSHSGRTDSNGGHYNQSTGEYHYHHGHPAHQHTNGTCPYNFVDNTEYRGEASQNSVATNSHRSTELSSLERLVVSALISLFLGPICGGVVLAPTLGILKQFFKAKWQMDVFYDRFGYSLFLCIFPSFFTVYWLFWKGVPCWFVPLTWSFIVLWIAYINIKSYRVAKVECIQYRALFNGKSPLQFVGAPAGTYIGANGLPSSEGAGAWGHLYTVYVSKTGRTYHGKPGCHGSCSQRHIIDVQDSRRPCTICKPQIQRCDWLSEYNRLKTIAEKYEIENI